jgi:deoxyguanosine kinase
VDYKFIAIEGNIGVGKTSLATMLSKDFNSKLILESYQENILLPKFYDSPEQYAFQLELSFLPARHKQLKELLESYSAKNSITVSDYYFAKSLLFAEANLQPEDFKLYRDIFSIIFEKLPNPDILLYLHSDTTKLLENINKRGRSYEKSISKSYLEKIEKTYFSYFETNLTFPVVIIDVNNIDFVSEVDDYQLIKNLLKTNFSDGIHTIF